MATTTACRAARHPVRAGLRGRASDEILTIAGEGTGHSNVTLHADDVRAVIEGFAMLRAAAADAHALLCAMQTQCAEPTLTGTLAEEVGHSTSPGGGGAAQLRVAWTAGHGQAGTGHEAHRRVRLRRSQPEGGGAVRRAADRHPVGRLDSCSRSRSGTQAPARLGRRGVAQRQQLAGHAGTPRGAARSRGEQRWPARAPVRRSGCPVGPAGSGPDRTARRSAQPAGTAARRSGRPVPVRSPRRSTSSATGLASDHTRHGPASTPFRFPAGPRRPR